MELIICNWCDVSKLVEDEDSFWLRESGGHFSRRIWFKHLSLVCHYNNLIDNHTRLLIGLLRVAETSCLFLRRYFTNEAGLRLASFSYPIRHPQIDLCALA